MNLIQLALRLVHILSGVLWVGFAAFLHFFLAPALEDAGPEAGKIMPALQRRGLTTVLPLLALGTILSGLWLYGRASGSGVASYVASPPGLALALSGVVAIAAYAVGMFVTRPAVMQAMSLIQSIPAAPSAEDRERRMAEARRLRVRGDTGGRVAAILLIVAAAGMAVARYL
jgi:hypothetical protein